MGKRGLPAKRKRFVIEYLIDLNATQAAIRAGYSTKRASEIGWQLLQKTTVQEAIAIAQKGIAEKAGITIQELIIAYKQIAFADLKDCYDENGFLKNIHDIPEHARMALAGLEVDELYEGTGKDRIQIGTTKKVKLCDKLRALDALAKHLGFFNADDSQKSQINVPIINLNLTKVNVSD